MPSIGSKKIVKKKLLLFLALGFLFIALKLQFALEQKIHVNNPNQTFIVEKGDTLYGILSEIEEDYGLYSTWWIRFNYLFKDHPIIKAGIYNIPDKSSITELIRRLEEGNVQLFKFAVIEGTVAQKNLETLENLIKKQGLPFGVPKQVKELFSAEGLIMPDTYFFNDEQDLVEVLVGSQLYLDDYLEELWQSKPDNNPLKTPQEALVLASIIEREAVLQSEQAIIASVFLARIEINMKLQADPTSSYGYYGDFGRKIGRAVLDDKNLYNTYQVRGLPPGPICYPSKGALDAAIKSSPGDLFYFVARGDGSHIFSKTYEEHNKAVKKYIYSK